MSQHNDSIYATAVPHREEHYASTGQGATCPPQYIIQQPASGGGGGFLLGCATAMFVLLLGCFFIFVLFAAGFHAISKSMGDLATVEQASSVTEKFVSGDENADEKIAVVSIEGMITASEDGFVVKQIKQVLKDEDVKAVVLRVDSPGGTMGGSDYYYHLLKKMKAERDIPIVVSMGSMAASGGYYVSMVGDEIFAERSTITGSIGVIVPLFKMVELSKKVGFESTPITSGPFKAMGSLTKPMSDEEKAIWQRLVDDNFKRFKEVICEGRENFAKEPKKLDELATGQIYTATEAEANGLIDKIGFLEDAVDAAKARAGLGDVRVIKYKPKLKFMDAILDAEATGKSPNILSTKTFVDLSTPRVYLICPQVLPISDEN